VKLVRAHFENFRLLRNLDLSFSTDPKRNLTVIRAENETGKTTILTALQWALYGDDALPGGAPKFRLSPIDWREPTARITVEVDFEATSTTRNGARTERRKFRAVRTATETVSGNTWQRGASTAKLFDLTDRGALPLEYADNRLRSELPPELREVFFTDGDRALSFIEADSTNIKRQRVENAIKSLLGLSVVEDAAKHVRQATMDINRKVRESDASAKARDASERIDVIDTEITTLETQLKTVQAARALCEEQYERLSKKIEEALAKGDRTDLVNRLNKVKAQRKRDDALALGLAKEHGELLKSKTLARQLLSGHIERASMLLEKLRATGQIPNQTVPVLADRLGQGTCICGESLTADDPDGLRRRTHIQHLIDASQTVDETQRMITDLYFGGRELMQPIEVRGWTGEYADLMDKRQKIAKNLEDAGAEEAHIDVKIAEIPDIDIQNLKEQRKVAKRKGEDYQDVESRTSFKLEIAKRDKKQAEEERDRHLKEKGKGAKLAGELTVGSDVLRVFEHTLERLKKEELARVSELMNEVFLDMIGSDGDQGAIIRKAVISPEFDIVVYGPDNRLLSPDRDLNGASRRALTLAFILALTRVSEVEAPNIIDTPLGMMSGYVKSSVVESAAKHSAQLVLFLTRSEIAGTERLLDRYAGKVITLTNPAHYPKMLVNEPPVRSLQVLRCDCSYNTTCKVCERRMDVAEPTKPSTTEPEFLEALR